MNRKNYVLLILVIISVCISFQAGSFMVELAQEPQAFSKWIASYGIFAQVMMIALVFLQVVFVWLPGEVFEVVAGYAFGFWQGTLLVLLATMCASTCIMLLVKRYGQRILSLCFSNRKIADLPFLNDTKKMNKFIALAFLIPGSPKDILTYGVGLTNMKVSHFLCISTFARIPSVVTSTLTGSALGVEDYQLALYSFMFTLVVSAFGILVYRIFSQSKHMKTERNIQK